jgi:hypothetical protein
MDAVQRLMMSGLFGLCLAAQYDPKQPLPESVIHIARLRQSVRRMVAQLPNCVCAMTIDRSERTPANRKWKLNDTVRLEVALVGGKELYASPGSSRFDDRDIRDLVGGVVGTGAYALTLESVALSDATELKFAGADEIEGRPLLRYEFLVGRTRSFHVLRWQGIEDVVGSRGSVWVERDSYDVSGLQVVFEDFPPSIPIRYGRNFIVFSGVRVGGSRFVLPVSAEQHFVMQDGLESMNRTSFSNCRKYGSESRLVFEEALPDSKPPH